MFSTSSSDAYFQVFQMQWDHHKNFFFGGGVEKSIQIRIYFKCYTMCTLNVKNWKQKISTKWTQKERSIPEDNNFKKRIDRESL